MAVSRDGMMWEVVNDEANTQMGGWKKECGVTEATP